MLDVKYYKDYQHNYLIIKDNGSLKENVYQRKMVTENKIKGLLVSQERYINGDVLLYYEITSRQSLLSIYDGKSIRMEQLHTFFVQLKVVNDMLQKYLLDGSCLLLQPEYIFQNIETGEYFFLYYPEPEENSFSRLMDFFISRVDNEDMEAVEMVYKIADLVNREQFVMDEILKWFQDDMVDGKKSEHDNNSCREPEVVNMLPKDDGRQNKEEKIIQEPMPPSYKIKENKVEEKGENNKPIKKLIPIWGISLLGAGALVYITYFYQLSYQEEIYLMVGWGVVAALFLGSMVWYFYFKGKKKDNHEQENIEETERYRYVQTYENAENPPVSDIGNTVFIPWTENCENKLYSLDKRKKCHIDLGILPLTVGKLAGAVDVVIEDQSISRMHAKFFRNENKVYITDLNSTNGTFRNGMRLSPNASELIEPGDEIRLGKLKFIYR